MALACINLQGSFFGFWQTDGECNSRPLWGLNWGLNHNAKAITRPAVMSGTAYKEDHTELSP